MQRQRRKSIGMVCLVLARAAAFGFLPVMVTAQTNIADYNYLPTGKEIVGPAGPLPAAGWVPPVNDVLNVRELGAKGDGITDDTKALQEIFKKVDHGQVIFFPAGKYLISDTLRLDGRYGVRIQMHGGFRSYNLRTTDCRGIFWDAAGPQDRPMMLLYNCSQVVLDGLKLDGGGRAQDGLILDAESSSSGINGCNVHVRSCVRYGLRIATWREGHKFGGSQVDMISFRNSKFTNCGSSAGKDDACITVESAQAFLILFDTCEFDTSMAGGDYNVYIRGGRTQFLNCDFLSHNKKTKADIFIGNNYTAGVNVYMAHSEGDNPNRYFLYVDRPEYGALGEVILDGVGAGAKVFFNAATSIQISNSYLYDITVPCRAARVLLANLTVQGKITLRAKHVTRSNVITVPR